MKWKWKCCCCCCCWRYSVHCLHCNYDSTGCFRHTHTHLKQSKIGHSNTKETHREREKRANQLNRYFPESRNSINQLKIQCDSCGDRFGNCSALNTHTHTRGNQNNSPISSILTLGYRGRNVWINHAQIWEYREIVLSATPARQTVCMHFESIALRSNLRKCLSAKHNTNAKYQRHNSLSCTSSILNHLNPVWGLPCILLYEKINYKVVEKYIELL